MAHVLVATGEIRRWYRWPRAMRHSCYRLCRHAEGFQAGPGRLRRAPALQHPYAAMPSLHVGWASLSGYAMPRTGRAWWLRLSGAALRL